MAAGGGAGRQGHSSGVSAAWEEGFAGGGGDPALQDKFVLP